MQRCVGIYRDMIYRGLGRYREIWRYLGLYERCTGMYRYIRGLHGVILALGIRVVRETSQRLDGDCDALESKGFRG